MKSFLRSRETQPIAASAKSTASNSTVEVGCETTRDAYRITQAIRQRICVRGTEASISRRRKRPKDWGDRWYWPHTFRNEARTLPMPAIFGGNRDRRNSKTARKVRPPVRNGKRAMNWSGVRFDIDSPYHAIRKNPGQFAAY